MDLFLGPLIWILQPAIQAASAFALSHTGDCLIPGALATSQRADSFVATCNKEVAISLEGFETTSNIFSDFV